MSAPSQMPVNALDACLACGYSLKTLADDGVCPECGLAVAASRTLPSRFRPAVKALARLSAFTVAFFIASPVLGMLTVGRFHFFGGALVVAALRGWLYLRFRKEMDRFSARSIAIRVLGVALLADMLLGAAIPIATLLTGRSSVAAELILASVAAPALLFLLQCHLLAGVARRVELPETADDVRRALSITWSMTALTALAIVVAFVFSSSALSKGTETAGIIVVGYLGVGMILCFVGIFAAANTVFRHLDAVTKPVVDRTHE
jgi:hypothetical protein